MKRIYEEPAKSDGVRVLVDRLWPRGVRKDDAALARWLREVAPSDELRHWFGHQASRWDAFRHRYAEELKGKEELLDELRRLADARPLTLLYGARDEEHNEAVVLRDVLLARK